MSFTLRLRAFFAVRAGGENWELIRDLAAALEAAENRKKSRKKHQ